MTPAEEARITLAAQKAAAKLPPMSDAAARRIAAIITAAEAEAQEREKTAAKTDAA